MINWIKYDPANPPQLNQQFLVCADGGVYTAELHNSFCDGIVWLEDVQYQRREYVTHYAHINLPGEETENA